MNQAIQEYQLALEANLEASKNEKIAKELKRKAYYRLIQAKDALRAIEREIFENIERDY